MLLKSHNLKRIIAQISHFREHIVLELGESGDLFGLSAHTYVTFVNERMFSASRTAVAPAVFLLGLPDLSAENLGFRVLDCPCGVGRQPFSASSRPLDEEFVEGTVGKEHRVQINLPVASADWSKCVGINPFPVVELTYEENLCSIGSPLTEHPSAILELVKPVIEMVVHHLGKRAATGEFFLAGLNPAVPVINGLLERHKIGVRFVYLLYFHHIVISVMWLLFSFVRLLRIEGQSPLTHSP